MRQHQCTGQQTTKVRSAGALAALGSVLAAGTLFTGGASAQEVLPTPPAPFKGQIGLSAKDSKPDFPQPVHAPKGAPNIVLVLLDDVGFGAASTFGGPCNTSTLDRLAQNGLRYTQFHTTALSSPTRAALLTGRNHHSVHTGRSLGSGISNNVFLSSASDQSHPDYINLTCYPLIGLLIPETPYLIF